MPATAISTPTVADATPPVTPTLLAVTAVASPGLTSTAAPAADACAPSGAPPPPSAGSVPVNVDGDGVPDRVRVTRASAQSPSLDVELTLDSRITLVTSVISAAYDPVRLVGGRDLNEDGRDEVLVGVGQGPYSSWIAIFAFDAAECSLRRVAMPDGTPAELWVGAHLGNGAGVECPAGGGLAVATFAHAASDPNRYVGMRTSYALRGSQLYAGDRVNIALDAQGSADAATLRCGDLRLVGQTPASVLP